MKILLTVIMAALLAGCTCSNRFGVLDVREWNSDGHHYKTWSRDRVFAWTLMGCGHYDYLEIDGKRQPPVWMPEWM